MRSPPTILWLAVLLICGDATPARLSAFAADDAAGIAFFEQKIRPVLVEHCYPCHSAAAGKAEGGLSLDTREFIRAGGDTGPAVVPRNPRASLLLTAISHTDPNLEMPLNKAQLAKSVIADVETWIKRGAPDPRDAAVPLVERPPVDLESGRTFWAYQRPTRRSPPITSNPKWAQRELDYFVLAQLDARGLSPSPEAKPAALARRLYFDLIGLPPTPEEVEAFVRCFAAEPTLNPASPDRGADDDTQGGEPGYEAIVDRLLSSPRFGERWGKHWLDVARFAESSGRESNLTFPHAWRYRDYVIDAVNADEPFDRFLTEQLAGDLLSAGDQAEQARRLIATGFLAFGPKGLNEMNKRQFTADLVDEQIDAVSRAFLASSIACARCHDHKSEPYAMEDYYALAGIFASTKTFFGTSIGFENNIGGDLLRLPDVPGQLIPNRRIPPDRLAKIKSDLVALNKEEAAGMAAIRKAQVAGKSTEGLFDLRDALRIYWTRGGLEGELKTVDDSGHPLPLAMGASDRDIPGDAPLLARGEIGQPGVRIPRGFPRIMALADAAVPTADQSGRLQLASWLTHPQHPLTARVMANRIWRHLLGAGIVRTVDNFGFSGERPSHPELLDLLALQFVDLGWSVKALVREIVLSRTYRQSSDYRDDCFQQDPDNRWLWRAHKRRLDAEVIRDGMLAVSGQLDASRRSGSLIAELGDKSVSLFGFTKEVPPDLDGSRRRSIYLPVVRDRLPDVLELFDAADPSFVTGDRDTTNVPLQALYLLNSSFVRAQSEALTARVTQEVSGRDEQLGRAFQLCLGRAPDPAEEALAERFFEGVASQPEPADAEFRSLLMVYCQALLATAEFRNVD